MPRFLAMRRHARTASSLAGAIRRAKSSMMMLKIYIQFKTDGWIVST